MRNHALPTQTTIAAGIILGALGLAVNWLNPSLFFGVNIFFGSFFVMLALLRYGTGAGVLAAALAGIFGVVSWHNPWGALIGVGEALIVGLMLRRSRNIVLLDTLYWFCLGMPLFLLYRVLIQTDLSLAILLTLKNGVNGIFNALAAALLLHTGQSFAALQAPRRATPAISPRPRNIHGGGHPHSRHLLRRPRDPAGHNRGRAAGPPAAAHHHEPHPADHRNLARREDPRRPDPGIPGRGPPGCPRHIHPEAGRTDEAAVAPLCEDVGPEQQSRLRGIRPGGG